MRSSAIKLFGKTIVTAGDELELGLPATHLTNVVLPDEVIESEKQTNTPPILENRSKSPIMHENPAIIEPEDEGKEDEADSSVRVSGKHRIPCPRCSSLNTRFCYFNNYCVDQPRHFCKKCQRYWTNGGAMRDLPVGSGRRKRRRPAGANKGQQTRGWDSSSMISTSINSVNEDIDFLSLYHQAHSDDT